MDIAEDNGRQVTGKKDPAPQAGTGLKGYGHLVDEAEDFPGFFVFAHELVECSVVCPDLRVL